MSSRSDVPHPPLPWLPIPSLTASSPYCTSNTQVMSNLQQPARPAVRLVGSSSSWTLRPGSDGGD